MSQKTKNRISMKNNGKTKQKYRTTCITEKKRRKTKNRLEMRKTTGESRHDKEEQRTKLKNKVKVKGNWVKGEGEEQDEGEEQKGRREKEYKERRIERTEEKKNINKIYTIRKKKK